MGTTKPGGSEGGVAVVALNMGGPADQEGVEPFLRELFGDGALVQLPWFMKPFQRKLAKVIARKRGPEVRHNYQRIGGGSPILGITEGQVRGAVRRLAERGVAASGWVAMRYTAPRAEETVARMKAAGVGTVVGLSLYPQFSPATGGSSLIDLAEAIRKGGMKGCRLIEVRSFAEAPFYLDATAAMVNEALGKMGAPAPHVLFSAHGIPVKYVKQGDPYEREIKATYAGVVARMPKGVQASLAFQSRVGPLEWLKPYTEDAVRELAGRGVKRLLMVPLAFVSDHIETLYEMDLLYGEQAKAAGIGEVVRIPALNEHPAFLTGLGDLVFDVLRGSVPRGLAEVREVVV